MKRNPGALRLFSQRVNLSKDGAEYIGLCPFHDEKTPSFKVFVHDGVWLYKCFGCGGTGNVIQFVAGFDKIPFGVAIQKTDKELNGWAENKELVDATFQPVIKEIAKKLVLPLEKYYPLEQALANSKEAKDWLLKERGITYDVARQSHLGYRRDLGALATGNNSDISNRGWITFPYITDGAVTGIKYRSCVRKVFLHQPGMSTGVFNLETIDPLETVFVTEGEFDAVVLSGAGIRAISLPSAQYRLTPAQKDKLVEANQIILAGDSDQPGQEAMAKLWSELQERTFLLQWPEGWKDANEVFMQMCGGNVEAFKKVVNECVTQAKAKPMPSVFSLAESMASANRTNLSDHPNKLRFPWKNVDGMVNLLPGSVLSLFATNSGMGKTTFVMNTLVDAALRGEVILNYSAELTIDEYSNLVAAHILKKNRNELATEDYKRASKILEGTQFYVGRNPDLITANPVIDLIEAGVRRFGATIAVLDHLHFVCRNEQDTVKAQENAFQRLKNLAVKYGIKVIVVGQPRKSASNARGKLVGISDAKGSETFGSDADAVMAIHRDVVKIFDPSNPPKEPYDPKTQIHLLKGRSQGTGSAYAELMFLGEWATFSELTYAREPGNDQEVLQM